MTAPENAGQSDSNPRHNREKPAEHPAAAPLPDVRAMLGTDIKKDGRAPRRRSKFAIVVNVLSLTGALILIVILLFKGFGGDNGETDDEITEDKFVAGKTLDIVVGFEREYKLRHGRFGNEAALAREFPVLKRHLDNLVAHNYRIDIETDAQDFTIEIKSADNDPRRQTFHATSARQ
ncbi:MAG: hypothetical protein ACYS8W_13860 [Planctomycetota bacterium]|jgi:hypothetical protein